jgi:hypothetical protein
MSNQLNHTTITLPEHHNGEVLPGGSGNCACEWSVLNTLLVDFILTLMVSYYGMRQLLHIG